MRLVWRRSLPRRSRSRVFQISGDEYFSKRSKARFCKWLLSTDFQSTGALLDEFNFSARERENLFGIKRYRDLAKGLGDLQLIDAFHVWTAELAGLPYFLTIDRRFASAITRRKSLTIRCRPITPEELLEELGVRKLDPLPYGDRSGDRPVRRSS